MMSNTAPMQELDLDFMVRQLRQKLEQMKVKPAHYSVKTERTDAVANVLIGDRVQQFRAHEGMFPGDFEKILERVGSYAAQAQKVA